MVALKRAPSTATTYSTQAEIRNEIRTPRIVTVCAPARPICLPNRPATIAPMSGATGTTVSSAGERVVAISAFERVELVDGDRRARSEQHDQDRQPDRRFGRGDSEDEEDEHLTSHVAEVIRERDEVQVDGEQHELDRH